MKRYYCAICLVYFFSITVATSQILPENFFIHPISNKFEFLTSICFLPDSSIVVGEKTGEIKLIDSKDFSIKAIYKLECNTSGERGLESLAVHPDFVNSPYLYFYYTKKDGSRNVLSRIKLKGDNLPDGVPELLLQFDSLKGALIHNGGGMKFGADGKLYLAIGEQTAYNSEDLTSYNGKLIRINPDGSIPEGNPINYGGEVARRIWSIGLRNPYTIDIDKNNGNIFINDVGSEYWEEINVADKPNLNFGWPGGEGKRNNIKYTDPLFTFPNNRYKPEFKDIERGCSITGGTIYSPPKSNFPTTFQGKYFYSDGCNPWINFLDLSTLKSSNFAYDVLAFALTIGPDGNLYYVYFNTVYRIFYQSNPKTQIYNSPDDITAIEGKKVNLRVYFTGKGPFDLKWQKNGVDLPNEKTSILTFSSLSLADSGSYRLIVSNGPTADTTSWIKVKVTENHPPVAKITLHFPKKIYSIGDTIWYQGDLIDSEDLNLPDGNFNWICNFHHDQHFHPGPELIQNKKEGFLVVPDIGERATNVWYRIILIGKDSNGDTDTAFADVFPKVVNVALKTFPEGLDFKLDQVEYNSAFSFKSISGAVRSVQFDSIQFYNGKKYKFHKWNNQVEQQVKKDIYPNSDTTFNISYSLPPRIVSNYDTINAVLNTKTIVSFETESLLPANFQWGVDDKNIYNDSSILILESVTMADNGLYRFRITNDVGFTETSFYLKVHPSSKLSIVSTKPDATFFLNYSAKTTPYSGIWAQGSTVYLKIPSPQTVNGNNYIPEFEYSEFKIPKSDTVVSINFRLTSEKDNLLIFPSPADKRISVEFQSEQQERGDFVIVDSSGKVVSKTFVQVKMGYNKFDIETGALSNGIYLISVFTKSKLYRGKVIK